MRTRAMVHFILLGILCLRQYLHSLYDGALLQVFFWHDLYNLAFRIWSALDLGATMWIWREHNLTTNCQEQFVFQSFCTNSFSDAVHLVDKWQQSAEWTIFVSILVRHFVRQPAAVFSSQSPGKQEGEQLFPGQDLWQWLRFAIWTWQWISRTTRHWST